MRSIWEKESFPHQSDVLLIGAGLTGLLTAIYIKKKRPQLRVSLLERGAQPSGASVKNAGFGCFGSPSELLDDIRTEGETIALDRVARRYEGLQQLLELARLSAKDLYHQGGHEIFTHEDAVLYQQCAGSMEYLNELLHRLLGFRPFSNETNSWGFNAFGKGFYIQNEVSLHSGNLVKNLVNQSKYLDINIHRCTDVKSIHRGSKGWTAGSSNGDFSAEKLILTTNGYVKQLVPGLPVEPARGQILLTSPVPGLHWKGNFHLFRGYYYFREYNGAVLLGGGRHLFQKEENTFSTDTTAAVQQELQRVLRELILPGKKFKVAHQWAGTMAFGPANEKEAIVKELEPGLFCGVRLGGMGVALSSSVARDLAEKILR